MIYNILGKSVTLTMLFTYNHERKRLSRKAIICKIKRISLYPPPSINRHDPLSWPETFCRRLLTCVSSLYFLHMLFCNELSTNIV